MREVYFDNASTAMPVLFPGAREYANPSAIHAAGLRSRAALAEARRRLCAVLSCGEGELALTSGGTESNSLAILGHAFANRRRALSFYFLKWAHPSVAAAARHACVLAGGREEPCDSLAGLAGCEAFRAEELPFVSMPQVCHETGDRHGGAALAARLKRANCRAVVHMDGAQGFCKEKTRLDAIDLYSFSAHKIHAPCGSGGLVVKKGTRLLPLMAGGGQEMGLRAGTENVAGAAAMAEAAQSLHEGMEANGLRAAAIKAEMSRLAGDAEGVFVNSSEDSSPYILNMSFAGVRGEVLANMLSGAGIYVSTGAACKAGKKDAPALALMGHSGERAGSAIRFSFSHRNSMDEARHARKEAARCVALLRGDWGKM